MLSAPAFKRRSLKRRLALWVFLPTVLISAIDLVSTYHSTDQIATLVQQQLLKGAAKIISEQLSGVEGGYEISVPPAAFELFASEYHDRIFYSVRSKSGLLIAGDDELQRFPTPLPIEREEFFVSTIRGEPVRVIAYAHALPSTVSQDYAITQIAQTVRGHDAFRNQLLQATIRDHLILLAIVVLGLMIALRWTLRPLIEFGTRLRLRQGGSREALDDRHEPVELAPIIFAMNEYVKRLDHTMTSYEQFVANTAHHLRTTFAIIAAQVAFGRRTVDLDATQREVLDGIQTTITHGIKVINQLLLLASLEHSPPASGAPLHLATAIRGVLDELAPLAQHKGIELGVDALDETLDVPVPASLVREVVANLLENAITHGLPHGVVTLSLQRQTKWAVICIVDNGPGIAEGERERVFERFYQIDRAKRDSSGLGLAIVREICDALGARVLLSTPADGKGLQVTVSFPMAVNNAAAKP